MTADHPNLHVALAAAQASLPPIGKDERADTGKFSYAYAGLPTVNATLLPHLAGHGLSWTVTPDADRMVAVGTLAHGPSGETVVGTWPLPKTDDPQRLGSALTYARRYLLLAAVGAAPDDDDDGAAARDVAAPRRPAADTHTGDGKDDQRVAEYLAVLDGLPEPFVATLGDDHRTTVGAFVAKSDEHLVKALEKLEQRRVEWADDW